jgi:geranylgeranyl diphosphate synthase type 3
MEDILLEPVTYYKNQKGKNIRNIICNWLGQLMNIKQEDIDFIYEINNNIHNASLVIDDIEDNSLLRRNEPCAHIKYGIPISLNAGYLSIFKSLLNIISKDGDITTMNKIIEFIYYLHIGQGMDIYYTQKKIVPLLEDYENMIQYKTGWAFIIIFELLLKKNKNVFITKNSENIKKSLLVFGLFFQIRDDYINLTDVNYWKEKGFCQDFDEEKISYLLSYYNTMTNKEHTVNDIINMMKDKSNESKIKILMIFHNIGLFDIIYEKLLELKNTILQCINIEFVFEMLPFHKFDFNDVYKI